MAFDLSSLMSLPELTLAMALIIAVMVWKLVWYGLALYKALQRNDKTWFVVLFVLALTLGDLGIVAIIYLILTRKKTTKRKRK